VSTVALEPRTFRDTTSLLSRVWMSRGGALLILLALAVVVLAPAMSRGRLFPRPTPYVATMEYAAERLRAGEIPQWNPHEHLGESLARDGRSALGYPATLVHVLLPHSLAWHVIAILHLWIAGVGAWMLGGRYGLEPVPRLMTGAAYMLCGVNVLGLESAQANVLVWLPWAALAVERLGERVTARRILLASLVLAVQFLGGDLLASLALVVTCTLALFIRAFWIGPTRLMKAILACALALLIALAASAVQWMPVMLPWAKTPLLALSDIPRTWPWGAGPWIVSPTAPALFGTIPLVLAAIAIFSGRRPRAVMLWTVTGVALALIVISFEVVARRLGLEMLRTFPRPRVLVAGVSLALAVLAGFGVETVVALSAERAARIRSALLWLTAATAGVAIVVGTALIAPHDRVQSTTFLLHGARLLVAAAMLAAAALIMRAHELPQWRSRGWAWLVLGCAELLAFALPATRGVAVRDLGDVSDVAAFMRTQPQTARLIHAGARLPRAFATWQSLQDAGGAGRGAPRYELWSNAAVASDGRNGSDALRIANVRCLVVDSDAPAPPPPWRLAHRSGSLAVYTDDAPLPRAWVALEGRRVSAPRDALDALASTQPVNPLKLVLLDDADVDSAQRRLIDERPGYWSRGAADASPGEVTYAAPMPEEVHVRVRQGGGGWLVISDAFAPGWRATIHDSHEPTVAAFGAFRAVQIPAGSVEVVLKYEPPGWREAVLISGAGGIAMLLLFAWSLLRPRGRKLELPWPTT
jgi:hypothetical protein